VADLRMLGPVQLWVGDRPVDLGPEKQRTVLAALLFDVDQPVSTETLIDRLWGARPPASARSGLYSYITRLRHALDGAGNGGGPPLRLDHNGGGYRLEVEGHRVDLHRFQTLVRRAREADGDDERRVAMLDEAVRLWHGEALADLRCEWAQRMRGLLAQQRLDAVLLWATLQLRLGRAAPLITVLRPLVVDHPLVEPLAARLMEALRLDNRAAEALDCYATTRRELVSQLGVEPGPELRRLHQEILEQDRSVVRLEPPPPPVSRPAQLPPAVPCFVGRRREIAQLDSTLDGGADPPAATVIRGLWGSAGVGKTALALHWAHRAAGHFDAGQLYVNLRGFDPAGSPLDPAVAVRAFLDALDVPPERIPTNLDAQVGLYRSLLAGKRFLVVLDNAATADQVRPLLPGSPGCMALVTSRNQLSGLVTAEGAHAITLDTLSVDEANELLATRIGPDRVAAEAVPTREIIGHCAGLPLALAVVAARAKAHPTFPLASLATGLAEARGSLDAFADADPTVDVRAVFSWSYDALTPAAARLFRLQGLHPGPDFTVAAAASLAGVAPRRVRVLLAELVAANLVGQPAPGRYRFHDLLRAYAAERAHAVDREPERKAARRRLLDHYLCTAYAAVRLVSPQREPVASTAPSSEVYVEEFADRGRALEWLGAEHEVLVAAVRLALEAELDGHAWQLAWALAAFLDYRGRWREFADVHELALAAAQRSADLPAQAHVHRMLGRAWVRLARFDDAETQYRFSLALCQRLGDPLGEAHTLLNLGWLSEQRHDYSDALVHVRQALDLYGAQKHPAGQASALNQAGWYHAQLGQYAEALAQCRLALTLQRRCGHRHGQASTWDSLGFAHHHLAEYGEASRCYRRALHLHREAGDRYREAQTLARLADSRCAAGDVSAARAAWRRALTILDRINHADADAIRLKLAGPGVQGEFKVGHR